MSRHARIPAAAMADSGVTPAVVAHATPLEELLSQARRAPLGSLASAVAPFVGFCVDTHHPHLRGRALVRWTAPGSGDPEEHWLPCLQSLALREGDRVMVTALSNLDEPVVIGVLDGFVPRPEAPTGHSHVIELQADESIRVHAADGTPLVEICPAAGGPIVQLLSRDLALRVPGHLRLDADSMELSARRGPVAINASDDVELNGERIRLNSPDEDPRGAREDKP